MGCVIVGEDCAIHVEHTGICIRRAPGQTRERDIVYTLLCK